MLYHCRLYAVPRTCNYNITRRPWQYSLHFRVSKKVSLTRKGVRRPPLNPRLQWCIFYQYWLCEATSEWHCTGYRWNIRQSTHTYTHTYIYMCVYVCMYLSVCICVHVYYLVRLLIPFARDRLLPTSVITSSSVISVHMCNWFIWWIRFCLDAFRVATAFTIVADVNCTDY